MKLFPIKLVIVEDEPISTIYLKKQIKETGISCEVVIELTNTIDAIDFFSSNSNYDLIIMDIHLQDGDCFKILNNVIVDKPIIFCTTYDTYAIKAFKYNSIDYLLKPIDKKALKVALKKYQTLTKDYDNSYLERMDRMIDSIAPIQYKKRFLVRHANKQTLVQIHDVVCFYSDEGDSRLIEKNGAEYIIDYTMERLEKLVNPNCHFRINRKMSVSIDYIHSVEDYFNNRLKIKMQKNIPFDLIVSRNRVKEFKAWLKGIS